MIHVCQLAALHLLPDGKCSHFLAVVVMLIWVMILVGCRHFLMSAVPLVLEAAQFAARRKTQPVCAPDALSSCCRHFLMGALPLMLEEAQFAADFMELYLPPESADAPRLAAPGSPANGVGVRVSPPVISLVSGFAHQECLGHAPAVRLHSLPGKPGVPSSQDGQSALGPGCGSAPVQS